MVALFLYTALQKGWHVNMGAVVRTFKGGVQELCGCSCLDSNMCLHMPKFFTRFCTQLRAGYHCSVSAFCICSTRATADDLSRQSKGFCDRICCRLFLVCVCICMRAVCWSAVGWCQAKLSLFMTGGGMPASAACVTTLWRSLSQAPS